MKKIFFFISGSFESFYEDIIKQAYKLDVAVHPFFDTEVYKTNQATREARDNSDTEDTDEGILKTKEFESFFRFKPYECINT